MPRFNFQNTKHTHTAGRLDQCPQDGLPEVVLAGRSNIGKSSLINALTNSKTMARVSQSPGKTRLVLYFEVDNAFYLTDLPGYGYARASQEVVEKINRLADDYLTSDRPIALTLVLIDIRHGATEQDLMLMDWLEHNDISYLLVLNKADKLSKAQIHRQVQAFKQNGSIPAGVPYFVVSTTKRSGIDEIRQAISTYI